MRAPPADLILIEHNPTVRRLLNELVAGSGLATYGFERLEDLLANPPAVAPGAVAAINLSERPQLAVGLRSRFPADMIGQSLSVIVTTLHPERLPTSAGPESFDVVLARPLRPSEWIDALMRTSGAVATGRAHLTPHAAPVSAGEDSDWSTVTALLRANQDMPHALTAPDGELPSVEIALDEDLVMGPAPVSPGERPLSLALAQTPRPQHAPAPPPSPTTGSGLRPVAVSQPTASARGVSGVSGVRALRVQGDLSVWSARALLRHLRRVRFDGTLTLRCEPSQATYRVVLLDGHVDMVEALPPTRARGLLSFLVDAGAVKVEALDPVLLSGWSDEDSLALGEALVERGVITLAQRLEGMRWQVSVCLWDVLGAGGGVFDLQAMEQAQVYGLVKGGLRLQVDGVLVAFDFYRRWPQALPLWRPQQGQRLCRNDGIAQQLSALSWQPEEQWLLAALGDAPTLDGLMERAQDQGVGVERVEQALSRLYDFEVVSAVWLR